MINLEDVTLERKVICVLTLILQQTRYHGVNWFHLAQNRETSGRFLSTWTSRFH